jgi:hypothetical protein
MRPVFSVARDEPELPQSVKQKKKVEGTPPQLGITLWSHLSSSLQKSVFAKMALP